MTTFIEFLEELEDSRQTVVLPATEVERLASLFGPSVRSMGFWNKAGDGSVEIPMSNIIAAVQTLDQANLSGALTQLKSPERFPGSLDRSSASRLIDALSTLYLRQFQSRVERFQKSSDSGEAAVLWDGIDRELFGA